MIPHMRRILATLALLVAFGSMSLVSGDWDAGGQAVDTAARSSSSEGTAVGPTEPSTSLQGGGELAAGIGTRTAVPPTRRLDAASTADGLVLFRGRLDSAGESAPASISVPWRSGASGTVTATVTFSTGITAEFEVRRSFDDSVMFGGGSSLSPLVTSGFIQGQSQHEFQVTAAAGSGQVELRIHQGSAAVAQRDNVATPPDPAPVPASPVDAPAPPVEPPSPPNIVIINLDDARADAGIVLPKTLGWLADGGATYTNAYVSTPSCCPSRATLMTGQFVHNNGQVDQVTPLTDERDSIQRHLSDAGWFTAHSGKYLHYYDVTEIAPNWDRWTHYKGGYNNVLVNIDGDVGRSSVYSTTLTFDTAIEYAQDFTAADDDRPFYLHIAPVAPHRPLDPEPRYANAPVPAWNPPPSVGEADRSDKPPFVSFLNESEAESRRVREGQLRLLMSLDDQVDRFMRTLDQLGELDNTLVLFTSDNGYFWGEHGRTSKFLPYTEAVEVPLYVYWEGHIEPGSVNDDLVSHIDILPTVLTAAGVEWDHTVDGRDFLDPSFEREYLLTEYFLDESNANFISDWSSIRNEAHVYNEYYGTAGEVIFREYYDLRSDPWELENQLATNPEAVADEVARLAPRLERYRNCVGSRCE